jgi:hypothetical protein
MKRKHIVNLKKFEVIHEIKEGKNIITCFYMFTPRIVPQYFIEEKNGTFHMC